MKIKNGFTLIELLAVIVILAIILVIAVPSIINTISDSKKSALQISAEMIERKISQAMITDSTTTNQNDKVLEQEITEEGRCITVNESSKLGLSADDYSIGGTYPDCTAVKLNGTVMNVKLIPNSNGKFAGLDPAFVPAGTDNFDNSTDAICFTFNSTTGAITAYNEASNPICTTDVVIPSKIDGTTVTNIGIMAFADGELNSVVIPSSVTTIGVRAFYATMLRQVTLSPGLISIGSFAFSENNLTEVTIPNTVTSIGDFAFRTNSIPQGDAKIDNTSGAVTLGASVFEWNGASQTIPITPVYLR